MRPTLLILYVSDQARSVEFYRQVLQAEPMLDSPGMTEFTLPGGGTLGLMPVDGIRRLLPRLSYPATAAGVPRCEIYLPLEDLGAYHRCALEAGAAALEACSTRDWGDEVGYVLDADGHVVALAAPTRV